jgi:hypothetical protein
MQETVRELSCCTSSFTIGSFSLVVADQERRKSVAE